MLPDPLASGIAAVRVAQELRVVRADPQPGGPLVRQANLEDAVCFLHDDLRTDDLGWSFAVGAARARVKSAEEFDRLADLCNRVSGRLRYVRESIGRNVR
jgi:hypothetical protein